LFEILWLNIELLGNMKEKGMSPKKSELVFARSSRVRVGCVLFIFLRSFYYAK
jgi:hypothetical protein